MLTILSNAVTRAVFQELEVADVIDKLLTIYGLTVFFTELVLCLDEKAKILVDSAKFGTEDLVSLVNKVLVLFRWRLQ